MASNSRLFTINSHQFNVSANVLSFLGSIQLPRVLIRSFFSLKWLPEGNKQ